MDITEYLVKDKYKNIENEVLKDSDYCNLISNNIKKVFGIELTDYEKGLLKTVINGQGHEEEKITSPYSSSLQSFLIFRKVSKNNTIMVNDLEYNEVEFEYKR